MRCILTKIDQSVGFKTMEQTYEMQEPYIANTLFTKAKWIKKWVTGLIVKVVSILSVKRHFSLFFNKLIDIFF